jgi:regulatory protein
MLARRDLSEAQIRQRLARRGHDEHAIDRAVARLKASGAIDDRRTAEALARVESSRRRRGPARVRLQIEAAGISPATARRAVERALEGVDEDELLEAALAKRLRRGETIADDRHLARLYRYLLAQGFEPDRILRALEARSVE